MRRLSFVVVSLGLLAVAVLAHAGGSFYGLTPGGLREVKGKIAVWPFSSLVARQDARAS